MYSFVMNSLIGRVKLFEIYIFRNF